MSGLPEARSSRLDRDGFELVRGVIGQARLERLRAALEAQPAASGSAGRRQLLALPECRRLATSPELARLVGPLLGVRAAAVRATLFDKTPAANWRLRWHQDRVIAVRARCEDASGFSGWSLKAGAPHVRAPIEVLERMLAVRIHLDPSDADNGALRVLPGSHVGAQDRRAIQALVASTPERVCSAQAGDALLMRPLIVHSSARARGPHRRVIHIEYADGPLPSPLEWHESLPLPGLTAPA